MDDATESKSTGEKQLMDDDERLSFLLKNIDKIRSDMSKLDDNRVMALQFYRGDSEIVEAGTGRSKFTTTDLMDVVEWTKPTLLEIFAGGNDICTLEPASEEDVPAVENQQLLINQQLKVRNDWFLVMHDWLDDTLKLKVGWIKYQWFHEIKTIDKDYTSLTEEEFQAKMQEPNITLLNSKETVVRQNPVQDPATLQTTMVPVKEYDATFRYTVEDEYPLVEAVPAEEVGFPLSCRNVKDADFFYHKLTYKKWAFKKKFGKKATEDLEARTSGDGRDSAVTKERLKDLGGEAFFWSKEKDEYTVYECYFPDPDDGAPIVAELCGDEILSYENNKYFKPPFHGITPVKMAHRICGYSFYDLLKELQKIRTALLRQVLDNLYFANNRRYFGDPERINVDDFLNNNFPGALVRTVGDPNVAVKAEEKAPLPSELFQFVEMINTEKDYHSGVPRSFQGVNPNVLNKTWRGQNEQVTQAQQRVALMARLIAEMGVSPLVSDLVDLNIRFLKKKTAVRYLKEWKEITPDNIIGKYDCLVNVGLGTGNKDQIIVYMQQLLGLYAQVQKAGVPVVTPTNVYNAMRELIKAMGFRNLDDFVSDPKFTQAIVQLLSALGDKGLLVNDPQIKQLAQALAGMMGLLPPPGKETPEQGSPEGTFPGQAAPPQPTVPHQPLNPTLPAQGGNLG